MPNRFHYVSWSEKDFDLPTRSTKHSAGYDFHSPVEVTILPKQTVEFSLEVKAEICSTQFLMIVPRSSMGFKGTNHITLTNTCGIIDSDYYNNFSNEGEIRIRLHNFGPEPFVIKKNDKICQGIFMKYFLCEGDSVQTKREGGFGSTGK